MDRIDIDKAVQAFMVYAKDNERPFQQLSDYLILLQSQGWTHALLRDVQAKALDELGKSKRQE
jgi:hypothetical protein